MALRRVLTPLARLLLRAGIGFREFSEICKEAFVSVAIDEFGVRGRPANSSRVAALTGVSRKEVGRLREIADTIHQGEPRSWNPLSVILHYWHHDPDFFLVPGVARPLPYKGETSSFGDLVAKYGGDLPPGAVKAELRRAGLLEEGESGLLSPLAHWFSPVAVDGNFFESMSFSLSNLVTTLGYNAALVAEGDLSLERGRMERYVWTTGISSEDADEFKVYAEKRARELLEELEAWIAEKERAQAKLVEASGLDTESRFRRTVGLGVYYFERGGPSSERMSSGANSSDSERRPQK
jgi:hypothetical protein